MVVESSRQKFFLRCLGDAIAEAYPQGVIDDDMPDDIAKEQKEIVAYWDMLTQPNQSSLDNYVKHIRKSLNDKSLSEKFKDALKKGLENYYSSQRDLFITTQKYIDSYLGKNPSKTGRARAERVETEYFLVNSEDSLFNTVLKDIVNSDKKGRLETSSELRQHLLEALTDYVYEINDLKKILLLHIVANKIRLELDRKDVDGYLDDIQAMSGANQDIVNAVYSNVVINNLKCKKDLPLEVRRCQETLSTQASPIPNGLGSNDSFDAMLLDVLYPYVVESGSIKDVFRLKIVTYIVQSEGGSEGRKRAAHLMTFIAGIKENEIMLEMYKQSILFSKKDSLLGESTVLRNDLIGALYDFHSKPGKFWNEQMQASLLSLPTFYLRDSKHTPDGVRKKMLDELHKSMVTKYPELKGEIHSTDVVMKEIALNPNPK